MSTGRGEVCQYVMPDLADCGAPAEFFYLARHRWPADADWRAWPVCRRHVTSLRRDLRVLFEVSELREAG